MVGSTLSTVTSVFTAGAERAGSIDVQFLLVFSATEAFALFDFLISTLKRSISR